MQTSLFTAEQRAIHRAAEKQHVRRIESTAGLLAKPFLAGTSLDVDQALLEMTFFGAMVSSLPCSPGSLVLDVGAGPCWVSEWLQKLLFRTCSLDLAEDMLAIGRQRLLPGSLLCAGDMTAVPLRDASVDGAVCYGALHHVPDWPMALAEIHRVLRPGGVLVLQEPGRGHHKEAASVAQMEQFGVLEQELPPRRLARACRQAGFSRAIIRPVAELAAGRRRIQPAYPFFRHAPRLFVSTHLQRLRATILERMLNLVSPLHLVVATKGQAWADSRRPEIPVASFRRLVCPHIVPAGRPVALQIRVRNTGLTRWLAHTDASCLGMVRVGISLLDSAGRLTNLDFARIDLPHDVEPGAEVCLQGTIPPLPRPGRYGLRFDMVAEGIFWFASRGSRPLVVGVEAQAAEQA